MLRYISNDRVEYINARPGAAYFLFTSHVNTTMRPECKVLKNSLITILNRDCALTRRGRTSISLRYKKPMIPSNVSRLRHRCRFEFQAVSIFRQIIQLSSTFTSSTLTPKSINIEVFTTTSIGKILISEIELAYKFKDYVQRIINQRTSGPGS